MTRVLTAPVRGVGWPDGTPKPSRRAEPDLSLRLRMDHVLMDLADHHATHRALVAKRDRLKAKLDDPALIDHPKRPEAVGRYERRVLAVRETEARIGAGGDVLARHWSRLTPEGRGEAVRDGWPETDAAGLRAWVEEQWPWDGAPGPDVPF